MVIVMKSKNMCLNKPQIESARTLHKLYDKDSSPFDIPSAYDLILEKLTWCKWFEKEYDRIAVPFDEDETMQEYCKLINVDWQDIDVSVIDDYLANKQQRHLQGNRLTFKDYKLKS